MSFKKNKNVVEESKGRNNVSNSIKFQGVND